MDKARELADSIVHRYLTLVRYQRYVSDVIRKEFEVSGRQLAVLRYLLQSSPRSVGEISALLYVRDATTSPLLERMERDGYVTRRRCSKDNRKVLIEPTDLGRELAQRAPLGTVAQMRVRLPELPVEELESIDAALRKLSEIADVDESLLD
ncbi:MAG: MarR family transcriptional regulator [Chloroflexi bacterium]|jgi:DNA-binding MarR family transcriptional regulator|nr:MarR family transcriptional regulator [Chloroflexota bacterium]